MLLAVLWLVGAAIKRNKTTVDSLLYYTKRLALAYLMLPLIVLIFQWNDVHALHFNPYRWL